MTATRPPSTLIAGDTWAWTSSFADYGAPTWSASIYFETAAATFSAAATDSGADHAFSIAPSTTATYKPGRYKWTVRVTDGTAHVTVEEGWTEVKANPAAAGNRDPRSRARRTLDNLEGLLEQFATTAIQSGSINGRSYSRSDLPLLIQWQDRLKQEVRTEEQGERAGLGRNLKTRFSRG